jgi:hypothetical protein
MPRTRLTTPHARPATVAIVVVVALVVLMVVLYFLVTSTQLRPML